MGKPGHKGNFVLMGLWIYGCFHIQGQNGDRRCSGDLMSNHNTDLLRMVGQGFQLAPGRGRVGGCDHFEVQPTGAFDFSFEEKPFKAGLIGAKNSTEGFAFQVRGQGRVLGGVEDLQVFGTILENIIIQKME